MYQDIRELSAEDIGMNTLNSITQDSLCQLLIHFISNPEDIESVLIIMKSTALYSKYFEIDVNTVAVVLKYLLATYVFVLSLLLGKTDGDYIVVSSNNKWKSKLKA